MSSNDFKQQHRGLLLLRRDIRHDAVIGKRDELSDRWLIWVKWKIHEHKNSMELWTKPPRKPKPILEMVLECAAKLKTFIINAHVYPQTHTHTHTCIHPQGVILLDHKVWSKNVYEHLNCKRLKSDPSFSFMWIQFSQNKNKTNHDFNTLNALNASPYKNLNATERRSIVNLSKVRVNY